MGLKLARGYLQEWASWAAAAAAELAGQVAATAELLGLVLAAGGKVLVCGNGGSAADALHFAAELSGRFLRERPAQPVLALPANQALLTALGNDYGFERVFARQVEALARPGDALLVISTSGRSPNVLAALRAARSRGLLTVALVGPDGLASSGGLTVDICLAVGGPGGAGEGIRARGFSAPRESSVPHVQEVHGALLHCLAYLIEGSLVKAGVQGDVALDSPGGGPRRPAVFIDRDGTLIEHRGYITRPDQVALLPGAAAAVASLNLARVPAVLVTNQAAVARGMLSPRELAAVHGRLDELLAAGGARLDAMYHCPHGPGTPGCACRKPLPGLLLRAAAELRLDLGCSWMVGDAWTDVAAGLSAGCRALLVRTGLGGAAPSGAPGGVAVGAPPPPEAGARWDAAPDLRSAVRAILARLGLAAGSGTAEERR